MGNQGSGKSDCRYKTIIEKWSRFCSIMWKGEQCKRCTVLNEENAGQWDRTREPSLVSFKQKRNHYQNILNPMDRNSGYWLVHKTLFHEEKFAIFERLSDISSNYLHKFPREGMYSCTFCLLAAVFQKIFLSCL